jgi:hypothetical protein
MTFMKIRSHRRKFSNSDSVPIKKYIYFDSLALKCVGLYVNLLGPFVAYSQPFNLLYK